MVMYAQDESKCSQAQAWFAILGNSSGKKRPQHIHHQLAGSGMAMLSVRMMMMNERRLVEWSMCEMQQKSGQTGVSAM